MFSGPLDISKAERLLGWTATPASTAFLATMDWYRAALTEFPAERDTVLGELLQTVVSLPEKIDHSFAFTSWSAGTPGQQRRGLPRHRQGAGSGRQVRGEVQ